jgi:competence protein ComGC
MENATNYPPSPAPRTGMAIASLVLGIVGFFTCGLAVVGAITGIVLGFVALRKARKDPQQYGGEGIAITGIIVNGLCLLIIPVIAAIAIPNMTKSQQAAHEALALSRVRAIGSAQLLYFETVGQGQFASLQQLVAAGMIDGTIASGEAGGYLYTSTPLNVKGMPPMYDTTARPAKTGTFGSGNRSFGSNETNVIYEADGDVEMKGTAANRTPPNGTPIQ